MRTVPPSTAPRRVAAPPVQSVQDQRDQLDNLSEVVLHPAVSCEELWGFSYFLSKFFDGDVEKSNSVCTEASQRQISVGPLFCIFSAEQNQKMH
jgi:hypothetical protein